ncbi:unnamed protein product, partial [Bubo scandiacus]
GNILWYGDEQPGPVTLVSKSWKYPAEESIKEVAGKEAPCTQIAAGNRRILRNQFQ